MEYKLIMAVSGFPSLYDTNSLTYRDLNMRSDAWRQVAEIVGVPESECRRKWKTLRDQHRRERQREKERRESGIGLFNYRPWRYSSILSFLNPFIDARAAGTNGWALDPQPSQLHAAELVGCSTTTETRSDDDENYGIAVADATTTTTTTTSSSSSSLSEFVQRKRPSPANGDAVRLKEAKIEVTSDTAAQDDSVQTRQVQHVNPSDQPTAPAVLPPDLQPLQHRQAHRSPPPSSTAFGLNRLKREEREAAARELLDQTDEEEEEEEEEGSVSPRPARAKRKSGDSLLQEYLRRMETREAQRSLDVDQRDDVTLFLLSLAPAMRRLSAEKQSWVRTKIQQLLHEAEFGATNFQ
ncbi:uncharacterized protein LOC120788883 isoform X2 [Xiphias gladius]|uniref:uncharacterized protein LOC120788883 isoform X2 n=1 Tax=Xiphias gladius TaxID=8245 RepID=UPI001A99D17A|nr:uncharacterized protein LOC120788883 isoform X2 [Xiphias gladius]